MILYLASITVVIMMRYRKYKTTMVHSTIPVSNQMYMYRDKEEEITAQDVEPVKEAGEEYQYQNMN